MRKTINDNNRTGERGSGNLKGDFWNFHVTKHAHVWIHKSRHESIGALYVVQIRTDTTWRQSQVILSLYHCLPTAIITFQIINSGAFLAWPLRCDTSLVVCKACKASQVILSLYHCLPTAIITFQIINSGAFLAWPLRCDTSLVVCKAWIIKLDDVLKY